MKKDPSAKLKAPGFVLSGASIVNLCVIYLAAMWAFTLVWIPLVSLFPAVKPFGSLSAVPAIIVASVVLLHISAGFFTVFLEQDSVTVRWCGITVQTLPVSKLKLFCAAGNDREDVLYLSCLSIEEIAGLQEKRLLKSALKKHDVPFRKRSADWQEAFAREYLNRLRSRPWAALGARGIIMLKMQPALQYLIQNMYPQLPYRNLTIVTSYWEPQHMGHEEDPFIRVPSPIYEYMVDLKLDGIHLSTRKEEITFLSAQQIQTVVRVDIFKGYQKYYPHHMPLMFVSSLSEQELAAQAPKEQYGTISEDLPDLQAFLAMMAATDQALRWQPERTDCCIMHYTQNNLQTIQRMCPDIHINDISANWLHHTDAETAEQD